MPSGPMSTLKRKIHALVETVSSEDIAVQKFDWFDFSIIGLIGLNVLAVILASVPALGHRFARSFHGFEVFSVLVFSLEYVLRIYACTENPAYARPIRGRLRYALTPLLIVDFLAILPFYVPLLMPVDLRILRALRLFRLFRLFKLGRYSKSLRAIGKVVSSRRGELVVTLALIFMLLVVASSLLYFVEREAQPDKFSSIPDAMWWGVVTLTTVGYGDVYPVTAWGKIFGSLISFLGIGLFALPAGILSAGFLEEMRNRHKPRKKCPHCGGPLEE